MRIILGDWIYADGNHDLLAPQLYIDQAAAAAVAAAAVAAADGMVDIAVR